MAAYLRLLIFAMALPCVALLTWVCRVFLGVSPHLLGADLFYYLHPMRKFFSFLLLLACVGIGSAQAQTTCGPDTLRPGVIKQTGNVTIQLTTTPGVNAAGQVYMAYGDLTITGVQVVGYSPGATNASNTPVPVVVQIIELDLATGQPIGPVLASDTTYFDTLFANGASPSIIHNVNFSTPLLFTEAAFIIRAAPVNSTIPVMLIANNPFSGDGLQAGNGYLNYNGAWVKGTQAAIGGGATFDADWLLSPFVSYSVNPTFTVDNSICVGSPVNYTLVREGYFTDDVYNIKWWVEETDDPSGYILWGNGSASHPGESFTYSTPGIYNVEYLDTIYMYNGDFCLVSFFESVTVNALPTVTITNNSGTLNASQSTGLDWHGDNVSLGVTTQSYTPTQSGSYYVVFTDGNGCVDTSNTINLVVNSLSENLFQAGLQLYPNPATGTFNLRGLSGVATVRILNLAGVELARRRVELGATPTQVDVATLAPGVYLVQVELNGQVGNQKLVVY